MSLSENMIRENRSQPPVKRSYSHIFFRHKIAVLAPFLICAILGVGLAAKAHPTFQSTAALWADAPTPQSSTIVTGTPDGTPSSSYQQVLSELLKTQTFRAKVLNQSALANVPQSSRAHLSLGSTATASGPQLVTIVTKQASPELAVDMARAVSNEFVAEVGNLLTQRQQSVVAGDQLQLQNAENALNLAKAQQLTTLIPSDEQAVQTAQTQYNEANADLADASNNAISVFDPAGRAVSKTSKKVLIFAAGGGILAGILLMIAVLCLLARADKSVRREEDLEAVLPVRTIGSIDALHNRRRLPGKKATA